MPGPDLHIIAFAVPYPPTYGGAIDVWNRVKALKREGVKAHLHCFVYGSFGPNDAIREECEEVNYYPRISWPAILAPGQPYIVSSRKNPLLLSRLARDQAPVLFEGIHTTGFLNELKNRKRLLRSHNVEHQYYNELAKNSRRFQYLFFQREALALERYESNHARGFDKVFTISSDDTSWYGGQGAASIFLPVFHGYVNPDIREGRGDYLLYQGDLSVDLNQAAVFDLIRSIPSQFPIIVAGKKGDNTFEEKLTKYSNLSREADVSEGRMKELLKGAQIIIIHSRHGSGMKVKIFPALYQGRHVVASKNSLTDTDLDKALTIYTDPDELNQLIGQLWNKPFTSEDVRERSIILSSMPSDADKAREIIRYL